MISFLPAVAVLMMAGVSCAQQTEAARQGSYKTLNVSRSDRNVTAKYSASVQGRQDVDIYPQVSGLITKICIEEGSAVKKGQTLFILDQVPYKAALETAKANVESAEAAVATAELTVESKEVLYIQDVISEYDLTSSRNELRQSQAALAQAKAELVNASNNLSYTEVKSPVNGTAGMISYRVGALVSSSISEPLVSVSDNEEVYVYFSLNEKKLLSSKLDEGTEVSLLLCDGSEYGQSGRIDAISGIVDSETGAVKIRAVFPNEDGKLRSGSSCDIVLTDVRSNEIVIPQEATYEIQNKVFVYKVIDGKASSAEVKVVSVSDGKEYIVESGLEDGDVIIAEGAGLVQEGAVVQMDGLQGNMTAEKTRK